MKSKLAVLSLFAMTVAGSALAGDGDYPDAYLWKGESTKTRAEVTAEMEEAKRLGQFTVGDDGPAAFANDGPGKSRAEVAAELEEAERLGLLHFGEGGPKVATPEQEQMIAAAGRRAAEQVRVAKGGH
jgi:Domain of unknown function (DUF4148)